MKETRRKLLPLLLAALLTLCACGSAAGAAELAGKTYVYEGGGFGGDFSVTLEAGGSFTYYEGLLSSYIGAGDWKLAGDTLILRDTVIPDAPRTFRFRVEDGALAFLAGESDSFMFVQPEEGLLFSPRSE